jgi:hypothetical protein
LEQAQKCGELNGLMGSHPLPLDNLISIDNPYKQTITNLYRFASTKKYHILSQK